MSTYAPPRPTRPPRERRGARPNDRGPVATTAAQPAPPKKKKAKAGPGVLGAGIKPFDNDPNTMGSYYAAPPQYDFSQDMTAGNFNDPFNALMSAIPVMQRETDRQIGGAMAQAGFTGNRYSSAAMQAAGDIGAASAERQNAMLNQTMYDMSQQALDRQMQAAQAYLAASPQVEDAQYRRMQFGQQQAQAAQSARNRAQDRADSNSRYAQESAYRRWKDTRYGNLPFLTQFLSNDLGRTPDPILSTTPGKEGARGDVMDMARILAMMYGNGG